MLFGPHQAPLCKAFCTHNETNTPLRLALIFPQSGSILHHQSVSLNLPKKHIHGVSQPGPAAGTEDTRHAVTQLSIARAGITGTEWLPIPYTFFPYFFFCVQYLNMKKKSVCFRQGVLTCAECACVGYFGLGFQVASDDYEVFLSTSEASDDTLGAG